VTVFVRNPDGRFLFYRRTVYPASALTVPSGHVDAWELPEKAAIRELTEEVSIKAISITANQISPVATDDIDGDSCRRGSDDHRWHTFLVVLSSPIDTKDVTVSYEGREPALLTLEQASRAEKLTRPVQYAIANHAADLKR
jgi:ADP-ribose pyrophosphatase YjhB (NUDIX family)